MRRYEIIKSFNNKMLSTFFGWVIRYETVCFENISATLSARVNLVYLLYSAVNIPYNESHFFHAISLGILANNYPKPASGFELSSAVCPELFERLFKEKRLHFHQEVVFDAHGLQGRKFSRFESPLQPAQVRRRFSKKQVTTHPHQERRY